MSVDKKDFPGSRIENSRTGTVNRMYKGSKCFHVCVRKNVWGCMWMDVYKGTDWTVE